MQKLILIRPGGVSPSVSLQAVLRESHQAMQKERAAEIERRKKKNIPLDDDTDWAAVDEAVKKRDSAEVARLTSGNALVPFDDYVDVDGYNDVVAVFRVISEGKRRTLTLAIAAAQDGVSVASAANDVLALDLAIAARDHAYGAFIKAVVVSLDVAGDKLDVIDDDAVDILSTSGLLGNVYGAARDYQRLSPGKEKRFGSPPPST